MDWLSEWPAEFRPLLSALAERLGFSSIRYRRELSGASGAKTYLAAPESNKGAGLPNSLILKIGPKNLINQELAGLKEASLFFGEANYQVETVEDGGGADIGCIAMLLAGDGQGVTFEEFYIQTPDPYAVRALVERLFSEVLKPSAKNLNPVADNVFRLYKFDNPHVMARELRRAGDDLPTHAYWWEQAGQKCSKSSYQRFSHGDLHKGNIIVVNGQEPKPYIIDFGRTGQWHVMRDLAKFEREVRLFLYLKRPGVSLHEASGELKAALKLAPTDSRRANDAHLQKACLVIELLREFAGAAVTPDIDWEFEYNAALLAQFIYAAGNSKLELPLRQVALNYVKTLSTYFEPYLGPITTSDVQIQHWREDVLWQIAYMFLRLDQLPSGGWSKTLPNWMETLWEGDDGKITRTPDMRVKGGTDLTGYAFYSYLGFLEKHFSSQQIGQLNLNNQVAQRVQNNLANKIGLDGGIGLRGRADTPVRVRHTLFGLITFLLCAKASDYNTIARDQIHATVAYLSKHLRGWQHDKSHLFGMFTLLLTLDEMLDHAEFQEQLDQPDYEHLRGSLRKVLVPMMRGLGEANSCNPRPEVGTLNYSTLPFFTPYGHFWRMERSNLLMYLPFLYQHGDEELNAHLDIVVRKRCAQCLQQLLDDITTPFDPENPLSSLIKYHRDLQSEDAVVRDWGLSAELAAVLALPATSRLLSDTGYLPLDTFNAKREALRRALLSTFDSYHTFPQIFKFTHGVSFSRYLHLLKPDDLDPAQVLSLDRKVTKICAEGVTEYNLSVIVKEICLEEDRQPGYVDISAIINMLVENLESGEHTPDKEVCPEQAWRNRIEKIISDKKGANTDRMIDFYNGQGGIKYAKRYKDSPIESLIRRISEVTGWGSYEGKLALDVGCGPGQYAKLLATAGFHVELLDYSEQMLQMACAELGLSIVPTPKSIYDLRQHYQDSQFDLIFACAMMVHVPRDKARHVYQNFHRLLKPGGLLFINYKIGDHTLISMDGRFFEYYRDHSVPKKMLLDAGFIIKEVTLRSNRKNIYNDPKEIHWANFYCMKMES